MLCVVSTKERVTEAAESAESTETEQQIQSVKKAGALETVKALVTKARVQSIRSVWEHVLPFIWDLHCAAQVPS